MRAVALVLLCAGCPTREPPPGEPLICGETFKDVPVQASRELDLLLVIDTSPSMAGEQESLARNFQRFANVLESFEGGLPNLHVGVITADLGAGGFEVAGCSGAGDDGALQMPLGCPIDGSFLIDRQWPDGTIESNHTGSFGEAMTCMAEVGVGSCEIAQPIAATLRALQRQPEFLREDAFLAVVFITDSDDCSAASPALFDPERTDLGASIPFRCFEQGVVCDPDQPRVTGSKAGCQPRSGAFLAPPEVQAQALRDLKSDPSKLIVAEISGRSGAVSVLLDLDGNPVLAPSCQSATARATPSIRLDSFVERFPQRNTATSICNEDLSDVLVLLDCSFCHVVGNPCLDGDIDRDPQAPGAQVECSVSDVRFPGEDRQEERLLPHCSDPVEAPCWRVEEDRTTCPDTPTGLTLVIERGRTSIPTGTHVQARCRILC